MHKDNIDVISLPIELDNKDIDGKFRFVMAAIQRAKALSQGAMPRIATKARKITTLAIEEVLSGAVSVLTGEAAVKAADAGKLAYEKMKDEAAQKESMPESKLEIEKEVEDYLREKEKTSTGRG
jgi:DNA-directed RNA polymerase subunit K/omega